MSNMTLEKDLVERMSGSRSRARTNYFAAYFSLVIAVVASALGTISVAAGGLWPAVNAVLAALPGIITLILVTFRFEARSDWWWQKYHGLDALYRGLRDEKRPNEIISKELSAFLQAHNAKWPSFGEPPS
jgi:hypothetical protein